MNQRSLLGILIIASALFVPQLVGPGGGGVAPPQAPTPSAEMQRLVGPIVGLSPPADAAAVASAFFLAAADVVRRDQGTISSTGQVRAWMADGSKLVLQGTDYGGKMLGFDAAANAAVAEAIGSENVQLDAGKRARLAETLDAIAWAVVN